MADSQTEAPVEPTQAEAPTTEAPSPDVLSQLSERLDNLPQQLVQGLSEAFQAPQTDPYAQDPYGAQQDPYAQEQDPYGGLDPNDPTHRELMQLRDTVKNLQQGYEQTNQGLYQRDIVSLMNELPDLQKDEVAGPVVNSAREVVQAMGLDPRAPIPIPLIKNAYKAWKADQYASQQQPLDQQNGVTLEGSGAAQQAEPVDPAEELFGPRQAPGSNIFGF